MAAGPGQGNVAISCTRHMMTAHDGTCICGILTWMCACACAWPASALVALVQPPSYGHNIDDVHLVYTVCALLPLPRCQRPTRPTHVELLGCAHTASFSLPRRLHRDSQKLASRYSRFRAKLRIFTSLIAGCAAEAEADSRNRQATDRIAACMGNQSLC